MIVSLQLVINDDHGRPGWNYDRLACLHGHNLLVIERVHFLKKTVFLLRNCLHYKPKLFHLNCLPISSVNFIASSILAFAFSVSTLPIDSNSASLMEDRIQNAGGMSPILPDIDFETSMVCLNDSNPIRTAISERALSFSERWVNIAVKRPKPPAIIVETSAEISEAKPIQSDGCLSSDDIISDHPSIVYLLFGAIIGFILSVPAILVLFIYFIRHFS